MDIAQVIAVLALWVVFISAGIAAVAFLGTLRRPCFFLRFARSVVDLPGS